MDPVDVPKARRRPHNIKSSWFRCLRIPKELIRMKIKEVDVNDYSKGVTGLELAVQAGNIEMVTFLIENGAKLDIHVRKGSIGILEHPICYAKNTKMLEFLLPYSRTEIYKVFEREWGANVNAFTLALEHYPRTYQDEFKKSLTKRRDIVQLLLDHDDGLLEPDSKGPYAFIAAVSLGEADLVKKYLEAGVSLKKCYEVKLLPLLCASSYGNEAILNLLLKEGADPNEIDGEYQTPLQIALAAKNMEFVRILLGGGATDAGCSLYSVSTMHRLEDRQDALMYACTWGLKDVVKEILSRGWDTNRKGEEVDRSALYYCNNEFKCWTFCPRVEAKVNLEMIWDLLKAGARCDDYIEWDEVTTIGMFLSSMSVQHDYYTSDICDITAPALMLKASAPCSATIADMVNVLKSYLKLTTEERQEIFRDDSYFVTFDCLFKLFVLSGIRPTQDFIELYKQTAEIGYGSEGGAGWLVKIADKGYSLKQLCRIKLRKLIQPPLLVNSLNDQIPLPNILKSYILFDDILPYDV